MKVPQLVPVSIDADGGAALVEVSKRWNEKVVLDDVSFVFEPGTTYVVAGRSGAGKSTLLNVLAGYAQPDHGTVAAPSATSYLFQEDILFSTLSARDNVRLRAALHVPADDVEDATDHCLDALGMRGRGGDPVAVLSGGERQRVQLASVLASSPQLVLLDEPTASLDPQTRREVAAVFHSVFATMTCVIVSHDDRLAQEIVDAVPLVLREGSLVHG
ncbi:ATP-binding cassette domain-containing protein [Demequina aestuarii]|uniref:ATP-binding cassette domain-containing protein n=1 Tax=Demequina aestuarii TaxID=327095 RepID=UPI0007834F1A|nr:ABC transporter ATP-binding protein [Demequina aestuarii]